MSILAICSLLLVISFTIDSQRDEQLSRPVFVPPRLPSLQCPIGLSFDYRISPHYTVDDDDGGLTLQQAIRCLEEPVTHVRHVILVDPRILAADCILDSDPSYRRTCIGLAERYFFAVQSSANPYITYLDAIHAREVVDDDIPDLPLTAADGRWGYFHDVLEEGEWTIPLCGTWVSDNRWVVCPEDVLWATTLFTDNTNRNYESMIHALLHSIEKNCPHLRKSHGVILHYGSEGRGGGGDISLLEDSVLNVSILNIPTIPPWIHGSDASMNFIRTEFFNDWNVTEPYVMLVDADIIFLEDPLPWLSPRHLRMAQATTVDTAVEAFNHLDNWLMHGFDSEGEKCMHHYSGEDTYWFYNGGQVWGPRDVLEMFLITEKQHALIDIGGGGTLHYRDMFMMSMAYYSMDPPFLELPMELNLDSALIQKHLDWACKYLRGPVVAYHYHERINAKGVVTVPPGGNHCLSLQNLRKNVAFTTNPSTRSPPSAPAAVVLAPPTYDDLLLTLHRHLLHKSEALVIHQHTRKAGGGELRNLAYQSGLYSQGGCEIQNSCLAPDDCTDGKVLYLTSVRDPVSRLESDFNWEGPGGSQPWAMTTWPSRLRSGPVEDWTLGDWHAWMQWPEEGLGVLSSDLPGVRVRGLYLPNYATMLLGSLSSVPQSDGGFTAPVGFHDVPCPTNTLPCQPRMVRRITDRAETAQMLERAKRVLEQQFALAVPFEEVSSSYFWEYVTDRTGGEDITHNPRPVVHKNPHVYTFPEEIRERILQENWADQELYEFTQRLHRERDPCYKSQGWPAKPVIFLISMHKTGTTTWKAMMEDLGYQVVHADSHSEVPSPKTWQRRLACDRIASKIEHSNAYQDIPWFLFYREAAEILPNARFVFIDRPEDEWLASATHHFTSRPPSPWRGHLYGEECNTAPNVALPSSCQEVMLRTYREHNQAVTEFFEHPLRSHRFMRLDIHNLTHLEALRHALFVGYTGGNVPQWEWKNRSE